MIFLVGPDEVVAASVELQFRDGEPDTEPEEDDLRPNEPRAMGAYGARQEPQRPGDPTSVIRCVFVFQTVGG